MDEDDDGFGGATQQPLWDESDEEQPAAPAQLVRDVKLAVKYNSGSSQFRDDFPLKPGITTIGRRRDADVPIRSNSVSSYHAEIEVGLNCVMLRHLSANAKTWIRAAAGPRTALPKGQTFVLRDMQTFDLGDISCTITFSDLPRALK